MRPYLVVQQDVTEVSLAEHNNVVKAFPSDRTDQPFSICVLPRGTRRCWSVANAYRSESADKDLTIGPVPVTNEIAGSLFPPTCFRDLICNPFCGWMRCDAKPQNMSPAVPHDQQSIEQAKRDCRHDEHIHRSDPISVVAEECPPALGWRVSSPDHVLSHARLSDICVSAWNKDPLFGVIGIQSGPRDKGPQWLPSSHGSLRWEAVGWNDC